MPYGDDNNDIYSNDDYEDVASTSNEMTEGNEQVIHRLPTFTSVGETMLVNEGSTIRLPCIVNRLGKKYKKVHLTQCWKIQPKNLILQGLFSKKSMRHFIDFPNTVCIAV